MIMHVFTSVAVMRTSSSSSQGSAEVASSNVRDEVAEVPVEILLNVFARLDVPFHGISTAVRARLAMRRRRMPVTSRI